MRVALPGALALVTAICTAPGATARAQSSAEAVVPARSVPGWTNEPPPDFDVPRLVNRTALALDKGQFELGVLAFRYGVTNWLTVSSAPPFWLARAASSVLVPNLSVKLVALRTRNLWISGDVGGYYAFVGNDRSSGNVLIVPIAGLASIQALPGFWIHPVAAYTVVQAFGSGDFGRFTVGGTAATTTVQVGMTLQYQLTSIVSLTLWGRFQPYAARVAVSGSGSIDATTTADVEARITPAIEHPWLIVPGVAFFWPHVRFTVGVGYGNFFVPGVDVALRGAGFVPDASFYFVL